MSFQKNKLINALIRALYVTSATALTTTALYAQQTGKVEKIEVTGSNIKRVEIEGPAPITVIGREDLDRSGASNLQEVMRQLTVSSGGQHLDTSLGGNTFAPGTSGISLRGLGRQTTLVLLNGRRVANYGFAQDATDAFVDLNAIPIGAIERIEILKDGASAIYGSDAIAGVVNIILRKDFRGVEATAMYGQSSFRDADERRYSLSAGIGNPAKDRYNFMFTLDYFKRDPLFGSDRPFSANANQTPRGGLDNRSPTGYPGTWLTNGRPGFTDNTVFPNCPTVDRGLFQGTTTCYYNFQPTVMMLPKTERKGGTARGIFEFTPSFSAFAEFGYNENESFRQLAPTPDSFTLPVGHNSNPYPFAVGIRYRFLDVGPRIDTIESETTRYVAGLKGTVWKWDWEAAYYGAKNEIVQTGRNYVSTPVRNALVTNGVYNFVDPSRNAPSLAEGLRAVPVREGDSELRAFDIKATGELFQLPSGPLSAAVGAERRKEEVEDKRDPLSAAGLIIGSGGTGVKGDRKVTAAYVELSVPILKSLESQLAVRHDRYSDFGNSTTPKIALSWRPTKSILIRGGYAEGFRAPSLNELYVGDTIAFPTVFDAPRCTVYVAAFGPNDPRSTAVCARPQIRSSTSGNPTLKAEESESWSLGAVFDITNDFSVALDLYKIEHTDKIRTPTFDFVVANQPERVTRSERTPTDIQINAPGPIAGLASDALIGIRRGFLNAAVQKTQGIDVEFRYRMGLGSFGKLSIVSSSTYMDSFKLQVGRDEPLEELAGAYRTVAGPFPRFRNTTNFVWSKNAWEAALNVNYLGQYEQFNKPPLQVSAAQFALSGPNVKAWTTVDGQVSFSGFKNLKLVLGARNLQNKQPPFANNTNDGYDNSTHDPTGRFVYGRITYSFK